MRSWTKPGAITLRLTPIDTETGFRVDMPNGLCWAKTGVGVNAT